MKNIYNIKILERKRYMADLIKLVEEKISSFGKSDSLRDEVADF